MAKIPSIVMLHYVSDDKSLAPHKPWLISCASFIRLLDTLEEQQYQTVTFKDIVHQTDAYKVRSKKIIITFDDCPKHLWDFAIPELQKRNMRAVFYMPTSELGGQNVWNKEGGLPIIELMDEADIKKLTDIGMEVGSHAHHHDFLELKDNAGAIDELSKSKKILEDITGKQILTIAYPYGSIPKNYSSILQKTGYKYGLAVYANWHRKYTLRRWIYDDTHKKQDINYMLSSQYNRQRSLKDKKHFFRTKTLTKAYRIYAGIKAKLK